MSATVPTIPADPQQIVSAGLEGPGWMPYPISPEDTVDGEPECEFKLLRTVGVSTPTLRTAFFSAQPSKFDWAFPEDETFVILDGTVSVKSEGGEPFDLGPNDAISVSAGSKATFTIHEPSTTFTVVTSG